MDSVPPDSFLKALVRLNFSSNTCGWIKDLYFQGDDERLKFLNLRYFTKGTIKDDSYRDELQKLAERESERVYNTVFANCSFETGKAQCNAERAEKEQVGVKFKDLNYGEVEFHSIFEILKRIRDVYDIRGGVFYDLGSGTGKALVAARLLQDYHKIHGIELVESLHVLAEDCITAFNRDYLDKQQSSLHHECRQSVTIECGSFLATPCPFADADVIFCNSTAFSKETMNALTVKAAELKLGTLFVTFTKALGSTSSTSSNQEWEVLDRVRMRMSWGPATVIFQRRV